MSLLEGQVVDIKVSECDASELTFPSSSSARLLVLSLHISYFMY